MRSVQRWQKAGTDVLHSTEPASLLELSDALFAVEQEMGRCPRGLTSNRSQYLAADFARRGSKVLVVPANSFKPSKPSSDAEPARCATPFPQVDQLLQFLISRRQNAHLAGARDRLAALTEHEQLRTARRAVE